MAKKPRRTRWTVHFTSGEPEVILGYNAAEAAEYYEDRGRKVARVDEGDYRARPLVPSGARPDMDAVQEAVAFLGLRFPVKIKMSNRAQFQMGLHRPEPTHPLLSFRNNRIIGAAFVRAEDAAWTHNITVAANLAADAMGQTLWHELTHAWQFERDVDFSDTVKTAVVSWNTSYRDGTAYANKPYEVEANSMMPYNEEIPLAR